MKFVVRSAPARLLYAVMGSAALHGLMLAGLGHYAGTSPGGVGRTGVAQPPGLLHVSFRTSSQAGRLPYPAPTLPIATGLARPVGSETGEVAGTVPLVLRDYFPLRELDRHPVPLWPIRPVANERKAAGVKEGYVTLRLLINERGEVDKVSLLESEPAGAFDDSASEAFSKARFRPGERRGAPARSQVVILVQYFRNPKPVPLSIPSLPEEAEERPR